MIIVTMRYRDTWLVNGDSPTGHPAPVLLKTRDSDGLRILGHAALNEDSGMWEVKVDAWRYGVLPTCPSRHLYVLDSCECRTEASLRLLAAAPALTGQI